MFLLAVLAAALVLLTAVGTVAECFAQRAETKAHAKVAAVVAARAAKAGLAW
jgi:hypothetical protein